MSDLKWHGDTAIRKILTGALRGMHDVTDDLKRTSSESAPHDFGTLEKHIFKEVERRGDEIIGVVYASVSEASENGDQFPYSIWTHEASYKLGDKSMAKPGGTGMSGQHYPVGNKYLERPFKSESKTYEKHIAAEIRKELT